jgi:hypothetical protein
MGYRALLKNYIRHLLRAAGDHYLDSAGDMGALSKRDIAELRLLAAEVEREDNREERRDAASVMIDPPRVPRT